MRWHAQRRRRRWPEGWPPILRELGTWKPRWSRIGTFWKSKVFKPEIKRGRSDVTNQTSRPGRGGFRAGAGRPADCSRPPLNEASRGLRSEARVYWLRWAPAAIAAGTLTARTRAKFQRLCIDAARRDQLVDTVADLEREFLLREIVANPPCLAACDEPSCGPCAMAVARGLVE